MRRIDSELQAARDIRRSDARARPSGGRPLKGKEPRVRITNRWEPSMLDDLYRTTGLTTGEIVERVHSMLKLFAEYRSSRSALLDGFESLFNPLDKTA